jgi:tartrate dehydrogenase/decarboxylase/D-malate dehydrogenase
LRREFKQYVNLRPACLMPAIPSPLTGRRPDDTDMWIVRENSKGKHSSIGGRMLPGTARKIGLRQTVMSRVGVDRVLRYAFDLARSRPRWRLTSAKLEPDLDHHTSLAMSDRRRRRRNTRTSTVTNIRSTC